MPELPEVQALATGLTALLAGQQLTGVEVASFSALKTVEPPVGDLVGRVVDRVERRGKMVCFDTGGLWLVVHLSRGGWVTWYPTVPAATARPSRSKVALRARVASGAGFDITEMGTEKRLALWVVGALEEVPPIRSLGVDPLGADFTRGRLAELLGGARSTLKTALTTQGLIAGIGNAYSDEALHRAGLSPFKRADSLDDDAVDRLHDAVVGVLTEAVDRSAALGIGALKGYKKQAMQVHGRAGQACPVCGDLVRQVSYATRSLEYCPTCQTGGKVLADRRLSRLLK
jgi:formamidopyrimidine-DNA glycosylase